VEVESPSTTRYDRDQKRPAYFALGVAEVWRVDLRQREVLVSTAHDSAERARSDEVLWTPPGVEASLRLPVAPMFRDLDW
jgi:Uma2 family endonuclease